MSFRDYPTLHLDTNKSKGTANSKKGYGCKWTWETIQHYTLTQIKVQEHRVERKVMDVNEHQRLYNITLSYKLK